MSGQTAQYDDGGTPLAGYATLAAAFTAGVTAFAAFVRRRGIRPPREVPPWDVALMGAATYKASRLLTKDEITSFVRAPFARRSGEGEGPEVMDEPRGHGVHRAVGDLVTCPFCTSVWAAGVLVCGYTVVPRATRLVCAGLGAVTMADWLQYAWTWTQQAAED
ncbi:DUF1360 domain-containing protein [Streptomyces sp. MAI_2237]